MAKQTTPAKIPLSEMCRRLKLSWGRGWNMILSGRIAGEKIDGKWWVNVADVARLERERDAAAVPASV
jgi:hypothetical protein